MAYNRFSTPLVLRGKDRYAWLLLFSCMLLLLPATDPLFAQSDSQKLQINYQDQLLSISARNVDIKDFFSRLAEKANITIEFPTTLEKQITLNRKNVSLRRFLSNFLRNMNHVIIYSGSDAENSRISEVHVYPISTASSVSTSSRLSLSNRSQDRIRQRIDSYKKVVENLRNTLSSVGADSSRRQVYLNRIKRYEDRIKNLENQQY